MLLDHIISSDAGRLLNNSICGTEISFVKTEVMRLDPYFNQDAQKIIVT